MSQIFWLQVEKKKKKLLHTFVLTHNIEYAMAPAKVQKRSTKPTKPTSKPQAKKIAKVVEKVVEKKKKGKQ
jgi:hypothetical protein